MKKNFVLNKILCLTAFIAFGASFTSAETYFNGFAGTISELTFCDSKSEEKNPGFDPELTFDLFFSGQYNFSQNFIGRLEFSVKTGDIIDGSIFKNTDAKFKIDEFSLIWRKQLGEVTNYLSFFLGSYEPIGSDIFVRRQFGIKPIVSKITNTWGGIKGSVLNSHFGVGGADIIQLADKPIAFGLYVYVNDELDDSYVLNSDLRFACVYRYFTFDMAAGIGIPIRNSSKTSDNLFSVDRIYWRTGLNLLVGNSQTTSLFVQAGLSDIPFTKNDEKFEINEKTTYLLFEPRFKGKNCQGDLTFFSLPQETVNDFIFLHDTLGVNLNIYTDNLYIKNQIFTFGINAALSFPEKTFRDLEFISEIMDDYNVTVAPYTATRFAKGELNLMFQCRVTDIINSNLNKAFSLDVGYKTLF